VRFTLSGVILGREVREHTGEASTVKQITARSRPREHEPGQDPEGMWAIEYAMLRDRGYSDADVARLATLHLPDLPA
jgi:hypothetical protein